MKLYLVSIVIYFTFREKSLSLSPEREEGRERCKLITTSVYRDNPRISQPNAERAFRKAGGNSRFRGRRRLSVERALKLAEIREGEGMYPLIHR